MSRGTTGRKVRIDDDTWQLAGEACAAFGTNAAEVMRDALTALIEAHRAGTDLDLDRIEVLVHVELVEGAPWEDATVEAAS